MTPTASSSNSGLVIAIREFRHRRRINRRRFLFHRRAPPSRCLARQEPVPPTCTASATRSVDLTANASDPDNDTLLFTWSVTGGRLTGEGRGPIVWDLSGAQPGTYTATVEVNDGNNHIANGSTTVTIAECTNCVPPCPNVSVSCPTDVDQGSPITFTASVSGDMNVTYNWSVSAGTISSGQGTSSISVDTTGLGWPDRNSPVEVGGLDPSCSRTASCSTSVKAAVPAAVKFDEYGNIKFNDEKARLDNYAIQLQNQPGSQGYIVVYGSCEGEAQARADRAKDYLVNTRGIDPGRIMVLMVVAGLIWRLSSGLYPPVQPRRLPALTTSFRLVRNARDPRPRRRPRRGRGDE